MGHWKGYDELNLYVGGNVLWLLVEQDIDISFVEFY